MTTTTTIEFIIQNMAWHTGLTEVYCTLVESEAREHFFVLKAVNPTWDLDLIKRTTIEECLA